MNSKALVGVLSILCATISAAAPQEGSASSPPDFSGKWAQETQAAPGVSQGSAPPTLSALGNMGSGWPEQIVLTQSAGALEVEFTYFHPRDVQPPFRLRYEIGGAVSRNSINMGRGPQLQVSKTVFVGARLQISTTHTFVNPRNGDAMTSETVQTLSLDTPDTLSIETSRSAVLGGKPSTTKTIYRRRS